MTSLLPAQRPIRLSLSALGAALLVSACDTPPKVPAFPLMAALDSVFRTVKPDLETVRMMGLRPGPCCFGGDSVAYVVAAVAIGKHRGFDSLAKVGEVFGIFLVDGSLVRVTRTVDIFPTPRHRDYDLWIARSDTDSIIVCGRGLSYGDQTMRRAYPLEYPPPRPVAEPPPPSVSAEEQEGTGSLVPDCHFR